MKTMNTTWLAPLASAMLWGAQYGPWETYAGPINIRAALSGFSLPLLLLVTIRQLAHLMAAGDVQR
jgi:hypothetical protein